MRLSLALVTIWVLFGSVVIPAAEDKPVVGVNLRGCGGVAEPQQDAKIAQLQGYGVKTVREGFPSALNERFNRFIITAGRLALSPM